MSAAPIRLLLINPRFPESFWSFRWALNELLPGKRAINPPLGLATVAALTPAHWQVRILDENVGPLPVEAEADVVGVCGMAVQYPRQRELLAHYRAQGCHVVAGGAWASISPEAYAGLVDSLAEAGKKQNLHGDLLEAVRAFYRNGIDVFSGFIVGFDHDTQEAFQRLYRFIVDSGIQVAMLGLLTAIPGTPLYRRLAREGRLRPDVAPGDNSGGRTNVLPLRMSHDQLMDGYAAVWRRLVTDRAILARIRNKQRHFRPVGPVKLPPWRDSLRMTGRLLVRGILPGGLRRMLAFAASLVGARPGLWPLVLRDWAHALAIRAYARRGLALPERRDDNRLQRVLARLRRLSPGTLTVSAGPGARLQLVIRGRLGTAESRRVARQLHLLLRRVPSVVVAVRVHELSDRTQCRLRRMLDSLHRHADRIVVEADRCLLPALDSSVFHVRLADG
ncbi:MAG TPA: DUF4070 domain-containing protein [Gammaproteobacteria bacterium]|nr:DUF4070 domain-containing protein [Gammaproteobacteria bacterium]